MACPRHTQIYRAHGHDDHQAKKDHSSGGMAIVESATHVHQQLSRVVPHVGIHSTEAQAPCTLGQVEDSQSALLGMMEVHRAQWVEQD